MPLVLHIHRHFTQVQMGRPDGRGRCWMRQYGLVVFSRTLKRPLAGAGLPMFMKWPSWRRRFIFGIILHGVLLLKDRFLSNNSQFEHRPSFPYAFWLTILCTASYFLIKWEYVYAARKAAAEAAGTSIGSSWSEAMNTIYSFPLWENILIYPLFIFLVWLSLLLAKAGPAPDPE